MKWLTFPVIALLIVLPSLCIQAQIPQKFNYQAIVRGNAGVAIANKPLGLRFTIRDGSATGGVLYSETQLTTTNTYGLVNLQVGAGTVGAGSFAAIPWGTGSKFLQVEVDTTGSASYVQLATVELITVPYALEAQQALVADSARIAGKAGVADSARAASTAVNANTAAAFTGPLAGDVGGLQNATVIRAGAVTAAKIATGEVVKSLNGIKDNVVLTGGGGTSLSVTGNTITVNGTSGTITGVTAGAGLIGGAGIG